MTGNAHRTTFFDSYYDALYNWESYTLVKNWLEVFNSPDIPDVLDLKATTWSNRPSGYGTVNLHGDVSQSKRRITGNVATAGCSTFDVVKRDR